MSADFYTLKYEQGEKVDGPTFLSAHPEDPYWLAHQLCSPLRNWGDTRDNPAKSDDLFMEAWKMARELKREWESK